MSFYDTMGNESVVPCPWCGAENRVYDLAVDQCLKAGWEDACDKCGKRWEIVDVQYSATVYVKRVGSQETK